MDKVLKEISKWGIMLHECHHAVLHSASRGHLEFVKFFISLGGDPRFEEDAPVREAAANGHIDVLKYLYKEFGADIHSKDDTALRVAAQNGHLEVVKYLCDAGADLHKHNDAAVCWASLFDHVEVVKYLCEKGADPTYISKRCQEYISFCEKIQRRIRDRAQKKIYFWWIPICYSLTHPSGCGKRMMQKNWQKTTEILNEMILNEIII